MTSQPEQQPLAIALSSPAGFASLLDPGYRIPPHIALLNKKLVDLATGRIKRLIVQMPPRHGKSELCSRYFPAWYLGLWPDKRIILASYEASFAASWGRKVRDLLEEHGPTFFNKFPRKDVRAVANWEIKGHDGGMSTAGAGGPITGKGANLFIIDDPVKNDQEANSKTKREQIWDWYRSVVRTRFAPGASCLIIMTRWHEDDLAGRLQDTDPDRAYQEPWEVLSLPALADQEHVDRWGPDPLNRKQGEALWPSQFSADDLLITRTSLGYYWWSALYQQIPSPGEGGTFKKEWFQYYQPGLEPDTIQYYPATAAATAQTTPTKRYINSMQRFVTVDLAATTNTQSDYTVMAVWGVDSSLKPSNVFLLDLTRERLEAPDTLQALKKLYRKWEPHAIWVEATGYQISFIQYAQKEGLPIRKLVADKDKVSRAYAAAPIFEAKRVFFPRNTPFLAPLETELLSFPRGKNDDQVDVVSYAIGYCLPNRRQKQPYRINKKAKFYPQGWQVKQPVT